MDVKAASLANPRRSVSPRGLTLIRSYEGVCDGNPLTVNLDPYLCPANVWTIGYGHVIRVNGRRLEGEADRKLAQRQYPNGITNFEAETLLVRDLLPVEDYLNGVLPALNRNQFDTVASLCFNIGLRAFEDSTIFVLLKAGDWVAAAAEFKRWIFVKGKVVNGQIKRRAAECELFLTPDEAIA